MVGLVDEQDVAPGPGQQVVHLEFRLTDVLTDHLAFLRAYHPSTGQDSQFGEHLADYLGHGCLPGSRISEKCHVKAGHACRQSELHPLGCESHCVEVVLDFCLDLRQTDEFVKLVHGVTGATSDRRNVLWQDQAQIVGVVIAGFP